MADATLVFLAAAREFRKALAADVEQGEFARQVRNALARVYLAAALLGRPGAAEHESDLPERHPTTDESRARQERLNDRFGANDVFVDVFDPSRVVDEDTKPIEGSLSGQLVEIDEDLGEAIAWLEEGRADALWDVRFAFEQHWGDHALSCLRPLHRLAVYGVV